MIKLDNKRPDTYEKDLYEAMVEEAMARWEMGWSIEPEDDSQSTKREPSKEEEETHVP